MRNPVARWLLARGLIPLLECGAINNCDIVGALYSDSPPRRLLKMVAVELKMKDCAGVLAQARSHSYVATESWVAFPRKNALRPHTIASVQATHHTKHSDTSSYMDWRLSDASCRTCHGIGLLAVERDRIEVIIPAYRHERVYQHRYKGWWQRRDQWMRRWRKEHPDQWRRNVLFPTQIDKRGGCQL